MPNSHYSPTSAGPISAEDRTTTTWIHLFPLLAAFINFVVAFPYLGLIAALFMYYNHQDKSAFVKDNTRESLNFQITLAIIWTLYLFVSFIAFASIIGSLLFRQEGEAPLTFFDLGTILPMIILGVGIWISTVVLLVLATFKASRGETFHYPSFKFLKVK